MPSLPHTTLTDTHSELVSEWSAKNLISPDTVSSQSHKLVWWDCQRCLQSWLSTVSNRSSKGNGCPYCSGRRAIPGETDLATLYPEIADQWSPKNSKGPEEYLPKSNKRVWWICSLGHEWQTAPKKRVGEKTGCPYCTNQRILPGYNDLATRNPKLISEWSLENDKDPTEVGAGSRYRAMWVCANNPNHMWKTRVVERAHRGKGCMKCSKNVSKAEIEIADYVRSLGLKALSSDRTVIGPKELDIYIPELARAIEFNGTYWHSEAVRPLGHREEKTRLAAEKGVALLHVEEEDYTRDPEAVRRTIRKFLGSVK